MSDFTVERREGGGYIIRYPNGYTSEWLHQDDIIDMNVHATRRRMAELEAIQEFRQRHPEIPVGTAGTATVRGVKGVRVMRTDHKTNPWISAVATPTMYSYWHPDHEVRDFQEVA